MEELLEYLARQLVDSPDEVRVERIARALRTVVKASAVRSGRRVHVEIAA